jgi:hypothetical protein
MPEISERYLKVQVVSCNVVFFALNEYDKGMRG